MASVNGDVAGDDRDDFGVGARGSHTDLEEFDQLLANVLRSSLCGRVIVGNEVPATRLSSATAVAHQVATTNRISIRRRPLLARNRYSFAPIPTHARFV
jgi:hypothetical protein